MLTEVGAQIRPVRSATVFKQQRLFATRCYEIYHKVRRSWMVDPHTYVQVHNGAPIWDGDQKFVAPLSTRSSRDS